MGSFTKEVNPRSAKRPLVFNGRLANRGLPSFIKEATCIGRMRDIMDIINKTYIWHIYIYMYCLINNVGIHMQRAKPWESLGIVTGCNEKTTSLNWELYPTKINGLLIRGNDRWYKSATKLPGLLKTPLSSCWWMASACTTLCAKVFNTYVIALKLGRRFTRLVNRVLEFYQNCQRFKEANYQSLLKRCVEYLNNSI